MGLLSWIADKVRSVIDWVADKLGGGSAYSGTSIKESVDVEKVLAEFKNTLAEEAEELETGRISEVTESFDAFTDRIKDSYPDLVPAVRKKRRAVYASVKGCIVTYAEKHISENDSEFRNTLQMSPGEEKKQALRRRMDAILREAEDAFEQKLRAGMTELHDELGGRLTSELSAKERQLEKELQDFGDLTRQVESGNVDLEKYENEHLILWETAACLEAILEQGEQEA